ncbi:hypothetical protein SOASR030_07590 [Leminorella grimontii]|uniref:ATP-grasp domain-containing protein n=1 Tax=Leminorella grimontii TaxID=82981 RepID=A0AAV5N2H8_9GAMM|nr:ATP-grasp domain-containing protein [Leminorella grimontii]KFC96166.1 putative membrane protein [Leminorella grimontii ATCC 33999 = DSM 5078]GKX54647.1 hypothetical protein SOASR030_07590 [Leminorella grimontii]
METVQIVYPNDMFHPDEADETFVHEYQCAKQNGIHCLLLDSEAAALGKYRFSSSFHVGVPVIWRGWMMKENEYRSFSLAVERQGGDMMTSIENYLRCHHLPGWYEDCRDFTPETVIVGKDSDIDALTSSLRWPAYFVKDYVKSLTTTRGSIARNVDEIHDITAQLKQYRGEIEGGICLRRVEKLDAQTERRYFSFQGNVHAADNCIPEPVTEIARQIDSPFFSIDMVANDSGELRLVEIGDGQVSDIKEWPVNLFVQMLCGKCLSHT